MARTGLNWEQLEVFLVAGNILGAGANDEELPVLRLEEEIVADCSLVALTGGKGSSMEVVCIGSEHVVPRFRVSLEVS